MEDYHEPHKLYDIIFITVKYTKYKPLTLEGVFVWKSL